MSTAIQNSPSSNKRKSTSLPAETVDYLKAWMMSPEHIAHPYPTEQEKAQIMEDTGIELKQLTNWFVNNRKRYWKPRVEARLQSQGQVSAVVSPQVSPSKRRSSSASIATTTSDKASVVDVVERPSRTRITLSLDKKVKTPAAVPSTTVATATQDSSPVAAAPLIRRVSTVSLQHMVSDSSSNASAYSSDSASVLSANEDDYAYESANEETFHDGSVGRTETVDVHILKPLNGRKPTIADVSILSTVPKERILCTYENCALSYRFPLGSMQDRKKVQSRRDGEIVRLKRKFLKLYLVETGQTEEPEMEIDVGVESALVSAPKRTYSQVSFSEKDDMEPTPRKRFCLESPKLWKEACKAAEGLYDCDLPTLEEATLLFGFSRGINV